MIDRFFTAPSSLFPAGAGGVPLCQFCEKNVILHVARHHGPGCPAQVPPLPAAGRSRCLRQATEATGDSPCPSRSVAVPAAPRRISRRHAPRRGSRHAALRPYGIPARAANPAAPARTILPLRDGRLRHACPARPQPGRCAVLRLPHRRAARRPCRGGAAGKAAAGPAPPGPPWQKKH